MSQTIATLLHRCNDWAHELVWGPPLLILLLGAGIYFTFRTRFFQLLHSKEIYRHTVATLFKKSTAPTGAITPFQALSTALAATIGTGNIAGVATAITIGGSGAIFWMWVSAFFGMMTAYAENVLGILYRQKNADGQWVGGAMYYLQNGLATHRHLAPFAKPLAVLFSFFCVCASFGIGNMTQSNSIATTLWSNFSIPPFASGLVLAVLCGVVLLGGIGRLCRITERLVPMMAIGYILGCGLVICTHLPALPSILKEIVQSALGFDAMAGGFSGALLQKALTTGVQRGIFSNEAGLGSSVTVHSVSSVTDPSVQGMWGIFGVFVDTFLCCTLTALVVLSTGVHQTCSLEGAALVSQAFVSVFGRWGGYFVAVAMGCFAFSTLLGWSYYGQRAMAYLFGEGSVIYYKVLFVPTVFMGAMMQLQLVWQLSDTFNGLMAIPNLIGLLFLSHHVVAGFPHRQTSPLSSFSS